MIQVFHRYVHLGDDLVHVLDSGGTGRPTLFVHGVGGSAWTWEPVAERLGAGMRMLAVDLPGYGESRWHAEFDYSSRSLAATLAGIVGRLNLAELDVVGFSWGGLIGLLTARLPSVRRLVMVDIPASTPLSATQIPRLPGSFADFDEAVAASRAVAPRASEQVLRRDAAHAVRPGPAGSFEKKIDPRLLERWPFREEDLWPELGAVDRPLLLVRGEESPTLAADVADRMVAGARDGRLITIAGCGHLVPLERPDELAAALRGFLIP